MVKIDGLARLHAASLEIDPGSVYIPCSLLCSLVYSRFTQLCSLVGISTRIVDYFTVVDLNRPGPDSRSSLSGSHEMTKEWCNVIGLRQYDSVTDRMGGILLASFQVLVRALLFESRQELGICPKSLYSSWTS